MAVLKGQWEGVLIEKRPQWQQHGRWNDDQGKRAYDLLYWLPAS